MKNYRRILAAIDFSRFSNQVLENAVSFARNLNAGVLLVNVIDQKDIDIVQYAIDRASVYTDKLFLKDYIDGVHEDRITEMNRFLNSTDLEDVEIEYKIKQGIPFVQLLNVVDDEAIDIVVMGAKGRSNIADVLVGSTALKMFRRCPVPLLSIRELD